MATYVLIPGAGGDSWYWHRVVPLLEALGHDVVAVDLPAADPSAGLTEYADAVVDQVGDHADLIVVAQSLAGFTAPLVCDRLPVELIVLLNAMAPAPHESAGEWWGNTGHSEARAELAARQGWASTDFDTMRDFFHDVPQDVIAEAMALGEPAQSDGPFGRPWPLGEWPDVPTRFLQSTDDRFFPVEFQRRVVRDRLGIPVDEMPGGHLVALSRPDELVQRLESYREEQKL